MIKRIKRMNRHRASDKDRLGNDNKENTDFFIPAMHSQYISRNTQSILYRIALGCVKMMLFIRILYIFKVLVKFILSDRLDRNIFLN